MIDQYQESLDQISHLRRTTPATPLVEDPKVERRISGLEMAHQWILTEAIDYQAQNMDEVSLKLDLWKMHLTAPESEDPDNLSDRLAASIQEDMRALLKRA